MKTLVIGDLLLEASKKHTSIAPMMLSHFESFLNAKIFVVGSIGVTAES